MGDSFQFLDIIIFALVAVFLAFRLRSVLGRRTGNEQRRDPFAPPPADQAPASAKVVTLPDRNKVSDAQPSSDLSLSAGLAQIRAADSTFDPNRFAAGARGAFEMIVNAFAAGDTAALTPLLNSEVLQNFTHAIDERRRQHETLETNLLSLKQAEVVKAELDRNIALVTVKFVSDQVNVIRASDNSVVEGDPNRVETKTDYWTFSRDTRSRDPNWQLVATHSG